MKSKKFIASFTLVLLLLVVSCFSVTAFASENEGFAYTVGSPADSSTVVNEGETVTLEVTVSQNSGIKYSKIEVTFNPDSLEFKDAQILVEGVSVVTKDAAKGRLVVVIGKAANVFSDNAPIYDMTGVYVRFNFIAKDGYDGKTNIGTSVDKSNFYDKNDTPMEKTDDYVVEGDAEEIYVYNPDPEVHTHIWQDATCLIPQTCVMCQGIGEPALGHSFTNYVSDGNATCETDGTKTAKCDRCDETDTVIDAGSVIGHAYGEWTSNGDNTHTKVCANYTNGVCGCETTSVTANCAGGAATCEGKAVCEDCNAEYGESLGHNYGDWNSQNDGTHIKVCANDASHTVVEVCSGGEPKCEIKPVCEVCNGSYGEALVHTYTNYVSNNDAACGVDGTKTAACDHGCGATDTVTDTGSALVHTYTNYVSNNDAVCGVDGTKTAACDHGCGTKDTVTDTGSALVHTYTNYASNNDAVCGVDGTKTATCDHGCGTTDTVTDEGSALVHTYTNYASNNDAACGVDGTKTATCDHGCGTTDTVTDEGSALEHVAGDWIVDEEAAAGVEGSKHKECTLCGDVLESATIDALPVETESETETETEVVTDVESTPVTDASTSEETSGTTGGKRGCRSSLNAGFVAVFAIVLTAGFAVLKKKESL